MKYLFELSKEHKTFPTSEIKCILKANNVEYKIIESNKDIFLIETKNSRKIEETFGRLSFTFFVNKFLFACNPEQEKLGKHAENKNFDFKGSIAIRYKNRSKNINSQKIVRTLADVFTKNRKVDLKTPDIEIRALITDSKVYVGKKIYDVNRSKFEKRKVQFRPFFSPISLHPKIARALVNLSCVKKNQTILDPFCGTGGIIIEAGLMGIKVFGSDIEEKMVEGCKKTLDYYNIKNYKLISTDIGKIDKYFTRVDAVVTDMPYGKSTTTKGEKMKELYKRSFQNISKILKENHRAVIGLSDKKMINLGKKYLKLYEIHSFRSHRSLTRFFAVFEK